MVQGNRNGNANGDEKGGRGSPKSPPKKKTKRIFFQRGRRGSEDTTQWDEKGEIASAVIKLVLFVSTYVRWKETGSDHVL